MFSVPQSYGGLCDLPHIRVFFLSHRRPSAVFIQIGNIILRYFPAECLSGTGGPASSGSIAALHDICLAKPGLGSIASQTDT